ncbi:hypothetical protein [Azohydromonas australica]|uniref:hypothetical protein n=1 Tax=Azohydromonas australica TaxID=364039 RepID=UPI0012EBBE2C|nr:hypothetical protein [Azohydromonas australica]
MDASLLPRYATLREVSLQYLDCNMPTAFKCDWILIAYAAGLRHIGVGTYFPAGHPRHVDMHEVALFASTLPDLEICATATDAECARLAFEQGVNRVVLSVQGGLQSLDKEPESGFRQVQGALRAACRAREAARVRGLVEVQLDTALSSLDGKAGGSIAQLVARVALDEGCDVIGVADPRGRTAAQHVARMLAGMRALGDDRPLSAYLNGDGEVGRAAVCAAMQAGATLIDVAVAGYRRAGRGDISAKESPEQSVATMLHALGVNTGVDVRTLDELLEFAQRHSGHRVRGQVHCCSHEGGMLVSDWTTSRPKARR